MDTTVWVLLLEDDRCGCSTHRVIAPSVLGRGDVYAGLPDGRGDAKILSCDEALELAASLRAAASGPDPMRQGEGDEKMGILRFLVASSLHPGMERGLRDAEAHGREFPPTQAGLALSLDFADYTQLENRGSYGAVGAGRTEVLAVVAEGARIPVSHIPQQALSALPVGTLYPADWGEMDRAVWDGQNHVPFSPTRSKKLWAKIGL